MDMTKLKGLFGRLKGIREIISIDADTTKSVGDDYNNIVNEIGNTIGEDMNSYLLQGPYWHSSTGMGDICESFIIRGKLLQLINFIEYRYNISTKVIEIGVLYNSIQDEELKSRCSDILSATDNFDRVINQSTQVLEDRIRKKSRCDRTLVGVALVNKALHTDSSKSILVVSPNAEEHEGVCHICRGLMMGFRNPTHHHLSDKITREEALKICAFVDYVLYLLDNSSVNK